MCEILADGRTVWVNDSSGCCIGRFSKRGVDVQHTGPLQMETGKQCLKCKAGPTTIEDWKDFQDAMYQYHGVQVSDSLMPKNLDKELGEANG